MLLFCCSTLLRSSSRHESVLCLFAFCLLKYYDAFKVGRAKRIAWYVEFGCNNGFIQMEV